MTTGTTIPFSQETVKQLSALRNEPAWFEQFRLDALAKAESLSLPKPDKTNISKWDFFGKEFDATTGNVPTKEQLPASVTSLINEEADQTVYLQYNGAPVFHALSTEAKENGVIFTDLHTAVKEHAELVKKYFMTEAVKVDEHKLTALHAALVNGGAFLYVPKNVVLTKPIQAIFVLDGEKVPAYNHVLVVADANSEVTYVENYVSTSADLEGAVANIVTEVITLDNAKVRYGAVDTLAKGVTAYVNRRGIAGRDSKIEWALGLMNDGNSVFENITHLVGDGSFGDMKMVTVGRGEQTQNFTTSIIHHGKGSEGWILKHGVAKDAATSIFNGIGKIEHGASKSNAQQTSRVLMLSEKARGDANPILLIDENDVMAGHAASVGKVDPNTLYYLMSRGIPKKEAERLVIHGFLAPVVAELPIEVVKQQLVDVIERKVK
jgi:Fe-S cluster assembly protein SufD